MNKTAGIINAVEVFLVVTISTVIGQITIGGQQLDLSTHTGQTAALSAVLTALWLGVRRAISASSTSNTTSTKS